MGIFKEIKKLNDYKCNSPILFITFTKEKETKIVFETIKKVKPEKLYIASDGPRGEKQGEKEKVERLREWLVSNINWNCEVKTKFSEKNLGCGHGPADAISWFFENEEKGIIIEDDILADISFFHFCDEMLEKYKDDDRIGAITGFNWIDKDLVSNEYFFSRYFTVWGWATWRRVWSDYDFAISSWEKVKSTDFINEAYPNKLLAKKNFDIYEETYNSRGECFNAWDYQLEFCLLLKNRKIIMPCCNLVNNIGFIEEATHTFYKKDPRNNLKRGELKFPLKHPTSIIYDSIKEKKLIKVWLPKNREKVIMKLKTILPENLINIYKSLKWKIKHQ